MSEEKPYTLRDWQADVRARQEQDPLSGLTAEDRTHVERVAGERMEKIVAEHVKRNVPMDNQAHAAHLDGQRLLARRELESYRDDVDPAPRR